MVAEVFAGLGAIKTAFDIAKGLKDIDDTARRNAAVIELQEKILAAQQAQSALVERVRDLEEEVTRLKDFSAEMDRYELTEIAPGIMALSIKETMRNGEPFHRICANCAANGKKFFLQQHISGPYFDQYKCRGCGEQIDINKGDPPQPEYPYD